MKRAGWITTAAVAAVAVVGGGTALALSTGDADPPETPAAVETVEPTPSESAEPAPAESADPEPSETEAPVETGESFTDAEARLLEGFHQIPAEDRAGISDEMLVAAAHDACDQIASGVAPADVEVDLGTTAQAPQIAEGTGVSVAAWFCDETD